MNLSREDKIKMFSNEIGDISDAKLKKFAEELIGNSEDYFFSVPASSSGKYHPTFDLGNGGLVRHTRCVAFFAKCMAESFDFDKHNTDLLIIAALAHDIVKQGNNTGHTVIEHPILAANYVIDLAHNSKNISTSDAETVADAVKRHMGKWGANDGLPTPETEFQKALQAADYIASRKEILSFSFRPTEEVEIKETFEDIKNYVIPFGKHKGETLEQAAGSGYLEWMVKQEDFFYKECQDKAKIYLERKSAENGKRILDEMDNKKAATEPATAYDEPDSLPF